MSLLNWVLLLVLVGIAIGLTSIIKTLDRLLEVTQEIRSELDEIGTQMRDIEHTVGEIESVVNPTSDEDLA
jgi:uncharacterized protein YoxC